MLAIARALMTPPRYLLLDEPSLGLAPVIVRDIIEIIREVARQGTAIVLVEQNSTMALELADHAYVLNAGRLVYQGHPTALQSSGDLAGALPARRGSDLMDVFLQAVWGGAGSSG